MGRHQPEHREAAPLTYDCSLCLHHQAGEGGEEGRGRPSGGRALIVSCCGQQGQLERVDAECVYKSIKMKSTVK